MTRKTQFVLAIGIFIAATVGGNFLARLINDEAAKRNVISLPDDPNAAPRQGHGTGVLNSSRPPIALPDLDGTVRSIDQWDGKVLVVNFWATWCPPCRTEMPAFNRLQKKYAQRGVQFVGVALDEAGAVTRFLQTFPVDYPILVSDTDGIKVAKDYGNTDGVLPYTVFVDRNGIIKSVASGGITEKVTETTLAQLL